MLELHDPNAHGRDFKIFAIPVILACREPRLFDLLREPMTSFELARRLGANEGHLQVAWRLLHSLSWLKRNERGEYCLATHLRPIPVNECQKLVAQTRSSGIWAKD